MVIKSFHFVACMILLLALTIDIYSQDTISADDASSYGTSSSFSMGVAGHDFVSALLRFRLNDKNLLMVGGGYKLLIFDRYVDYKSSYTVSAGLTHFLRKGLRYNKKNRTTFVHSGIYCLGGYSLGASVEPFGPISESYLSFGYHNELFFGQRVGQSFSILMGPCLSLLNSDASYNFNLFGDKTKFLTSLYLSLQYNLFFSKKK